jgi:uncharacterized protein (DUF983 family)
MQLSSGARQRLRPWSFEDQETMGHQPSPFATGFRCRCPRCGEGRLLAGFLTVRPRCDSCGLDLGFAESADGPAIFIIFIVGFLIMTLAGVTEALFHPAPFVHLLLWLPAALLFSLLLMRPFKATMIALQYRHRGPEAQGR